jgi:hypothetical protein
MPLPGGGTVNTTPVPDNPLSAGVSGQVIGSPRTGLRRRSSSPVAMFGCSLELALQRLGPDP